MICYHGIVHMHRPPTVVNFVFVERNGGQIGETRPRKSDPCVWPSRWSKAPVQTTVIAQERSPITHCAPEAATNHVAFNAFEAVTWNSNNFINNCVIKSANSLPKCLPHGLFSISLENCGKIGLPNTPNNPWGSQKYKIPTRG